MVERPIKKSERQASEASDATSASTETQPSQVEGSTALPDGIKPASSSRPVKKGDAPRNDVPRGDAPRSEDKRGKRNDRGKKSEKADAPPINPALMRGPRPPKPSAAKPEETPSEAETSEAEVES